MTDERICRNCKKFTVIDGKPLCFAIKGKQGRPVPRGVEPKNKCHNGRFEARRTVQEIKAQIKNK